jgi:beta-glucosidase
LRYFLPSFRATVNAGAATLMINSGEINGVPVHASHQILRKILREELGFKGLAVTDWQDIEKLNFYHHIAATGEEAVRIAVDAGIDMSMVPDDYTFPDYLYNLVTSGVISEDRLNESVERILATKVSNYIEDYTGDRTQFLLEINVNTVADHL